MGNGVTLRAGKSVNIVLSPIWKGFYSKKKEFAPLWEQILSF